MNSTSLSHVSNINKTTKKRATGHWVAIRDIARDLAVVDSHIDTCGRMVRLNLDVLEGNLKAAMRRRKVIGELTSQMAQLGHLGIRLAA